MASASRELGRGGAARPPLAGLGQPLDQLGQARRVVGDRLEAVLEGGDGLVAVARTHLDLGDQVIGLGELGLLAGSPRGGASIAWCGGPHRWLGAPGLGGQGPA